MTTKKFIFWMVITSAVALLIGSVSGFLIGYAVAGGFDSYEEAHSGVFFDPTEEIFKGNKKQSSNSNSNNEQKEEMNTPVAKHGQLRVKGTKIVDKNGEPYILQGVSTHGIAWFPQYVNKEAFQTLRDDFKVNTVRLALYSGEGEGYSESWHAKVLEGVEYAKELGIYVIVDWHLMQDSNPLNRQSQAEKFFKEMAEKLKDYDNVLYEICNEPQNGTSWSDVKKYAEYIIPKIRKIDDDAIIIVGTPNWSQDVDVAAEDPLDSKKLGGNIVYALHFYSGTHKEWLRDKAQKALDKGLPILVSEFGICDASGNGNIDEASADEWLKWMRERKIGYINWNLSNKNESAAFLAPDNSKISGWNDGDLSQSGKWVKRSYVAE